MGNREPEEDFLLRVSARSRRSSPSSACEYIHCGRENRGRRIWIRLSPPDNSLWLLETSIHSRLQVAQVREYTLLPLLSVLYRSAKGFKPEEKRTDCKSLADTKGVNVPMSVPVMW